MPVTLGNGSPTVTIADDYEDGNSLGPYQLLESVQFEVRDNPVMVQFGTLSPIGTALWDQSIEIPFEPGTYALDDIQGVRFRNAIQGAIATVSSMGFLTGDPSPVSAFGNIAGDTRFGPALFPWQFITLNSSGDYELPDTGEPNLPNDVTAFQLAPGYRGIILFMTPAPHDMWLQIQPVWWGNNNSIAAFDSSIQHFIPAGTSEPLIFAFDIPANYLLIQFLGSALDAGDQIGVGVYQSNFEPGSYIGNNLPAIGNTPLLFNPAGSIPAGGTLNYQIPSYFGFADIALANGSAEPFLFQLLLQNQASANVGIPWVAFVPAFASPVYGILKDTLWLPPGKNVMQVTNRGASAAAPPYTLNGRYKGIAG